MEGRGEGNPKVGFKLKPKANFLNKVVVYHTPIRKIQKLGGEKEEEEKRREREREREREVSIIHTHTHCAQVTTNIRTGRTVFW